MPGRVALVFLDDGLHPLARAGARLGGHQGPRRRPGLIAVGSNWLW